jgi:hypothetical protein
MKNFHPVYENRIPRPKRLFARRKRPQGKDVLCGLFSLK